MSAPVFATVAILTFLPAWNPYLRPLMVVQEESKRPVPVFFLAFQRSFVSSIAATGVKG